MPVQLFPNLINLLSFVALGTTFLLIVRGNLPTQVRLFAVQSFVLAVMAATVAIFTGSLELFGVAVILCALKSFYIPRVLNRAVTNIGVQVSTAPYLGPSIALLVCGLLVMVAFYVMGPIVASNPLPTAGAIPLAFAGVLIGFFITVNRRRVLTQILGFLVLENSIFQLALLTTYGVPFIVEMGVFLDVLVAALIMAVFVYRIKANFDSLDVDQLEALKG